MEDFIKKTSMSFDNNEKTPKAPRKQSFEPSHRARKQSVYSK